VAHRQPFRRGQRIVALALVGAAVGQLQKVAETLAFGVVEGSGYGALSGPLEVGSGTADYTPTPGGNEALQLPAARPGYGDAG